MKTILIATDFSKAAHNAALYSMELAKAFNARLMLFNSFQPVPVSVDVAPVFVPLGYLSASALDTLHNEAETINPVHEVAVTTGFEEALTTEDAILQAASAIQADLIVLGMKEHNQGIRKWFGSTVTALANKTTIPLLVVPESNSYQSISSIALANERDMAPEADIHLLNSLHDMATHFNARVYLIRIVENQFREKNELLNPPRQLTRALNGLNPVYTCMEGKDITDALCLFIDKYRIDLLAVMPHKLSLLERLFFQSITRNLIFEINIPLLILPNVV